MDKVEHILSICTTIYNMVENVKANKERCQRVAQRVKALQELVLTIKQRGPGQITATVENALKELCSTLVFAKGLMVKYSQTNAVMSFLKSSSHEDKFLKVNERLTDNFQVLSGALQIEQGNILYKVFETVAGRRQDEEYYSGQAPTSSYYPMPVSSPTTPMPLPGIMSPRPVSIPTAPMPVPCIMSPRPVSSSTIPMPVPCIMSPRPVSSSTIPMPVPCIMSPRPVSTMAPIRFSTTIVPRPAIAIVSPIVISSTIAPKPVLRTIVPVRAPCTVAPVTLIRPIAPMTISTQNASVLRSYSLDSYFP